MGSISKQQVSMKADQEEPSSKSIKIKQSEADQNWDKPHI